MRSSADLARDLIELVHVWNALKTSRKVLGSDMPQAQEAQRFESRAEQILKEGVETADRLRTRNGKVFESEIIDYIADAVTRCM
jgi:hypothetical protein